MVRSAQIFSNRRSIAFALLRGDGSVVTWGDSRFGGRTLETGLLSCHRDHVGTSYSTVMDFVYGVVSGPYWILDMA